jgi:hypothetical protein
LTLLKPHQQDALQKLRNGSILWGGVGSGKSRVACAFYMKQYADANVYVITTARKRDSLDWNEEFSRFGVGTSLDGTTAGVLVVDSWNNIHKYEDVEHAFFIFDEQRLVGRGGWVKSFLKIAKANHWILLSATPGDTWLDYIPVFLAHGFYRNRTEFKARHVIYKSYTKFPAVDRYVDQGKLMKLRSQILVEMPYQRHTVRHTIAIPVDHDAEMMKKIEKKRWNPWKDQPIRSSAELFYLMRKCVNSDKSRLDALMKKVEKHQKLIVFYNFDYELDILRTIMDVPVAEWNGHKHQEIPKTDSWVYLVEYTAGSEAWNCTETNATFFWSQNYSYKKTEQAYGRIDRLDTPFVNLFYYVPLSSAWIDKAIRSSIVAKRSFNEAEILDFA